MTMNPRDKNKKEEIDPNFNKLQICSSRQWTNNKNPRIVRASRTFGGKDRHSKVCTVRGLRDRRIRLSVPTAIQLYDLQDRLGLSQPSKVVDWLIQATKHEIDKLPPLPMLPQFQDPALLQQSVSNSNSPYALSHFFPPFSVKDLGFMNQEKEGTKDQENQGFGGFVAQNLFPVTNIQPSFVPNVPYTNPYNFHWDPPGLSLSRFGEGYSFSDQDQHHQASSSHLYFAPTEANMVPSIIPQFPASYNMGENIDRRSSQIYNPSVTPTTLHLNSSPMRSRTVQSPENNYRREESEEGNRHS